MCDRAEAMSAADDVESQVLVASVRAQLHLRAGRQADAAAASAAALGLLDGADAPMVLADVLAVCARVSAAGADSRGAERDLDRAAGLYRAKGNVAGLRRIDELRDELRLRPINA
jgi:hypothetical protein